MSQKIGGKFIRVKKKAVKAKSTGKAHKEKVYWILKKEFNKNLK